MGGACMQDYAIQYSILWVMLCFCFCFFPHVFVQVERIRLLPPQIWVIGWFFGDTPLGQVYTWFLFCSFFFLPNQLGLAKKKRVKSGFDHESMSVHVCVFIYLDLSNAKLSPERCWQGPRSQEAGKGELYLMLHCQHQSDSCFKMGSKESHFPP